MDRLTQIQIKQLIALLEQKVTLQLYEIMQQPSLQRLRARWIGLHYLVFQSRDYSTVKLRLLNISWEVLKKDLLKSAEIDQCFLFDKINNWEFGIAGGEPFGMLIGDYQFDVNTVSNSQALKDIEALKILAEICAVSFTVFISSITASLFGLDNYRQLAGKEHLKVDMSKSSELAWQSLRESEQARFLGFVIPQVLLNSYYEQQCELQRTYYDNEILIWSNAIYAYAFVFVRCFTETGWFLDALGVSESNENRLQRGIISALKSPDFITKNKTMGERLLTETIITGEQEMALNLLGIGVLHHFPHTMQAAFVNAPSIKLTQQSQGEITNEYLSCFLIYLLCVCRFAHYLKIMGRNKLGRYDKVENCQAELNRWLNNYVASNTDLSDSLKSRYPLKAGKVEVKLQKGMQDKYMCIMQLCPHLRTNQIGATISLKTSIGSVHG